MRDPGLVVLEMERLGKRLQAMLRVGRLNTMNWEEFRQLVSLMERLQVTLTDFNVTHFGAANHSESQ